MALSGGIGYPVLGRFRIGGPVRSISDVPNSRLSAQKRSTSFDDQHASVGGTAPSLSRISGSTLLYAISAPPTSASSTGSLGGASSSKAATSRSLVGACSESCSASSEAARERAGEHRRGPHCCPGFVSAMITFSTWPLLLQVELALHLRHASAKERGRHIVATKVTRAQSVLRSFDTPIEAEHGTHTTRRQEERRR